MKLNEYVFILRWRNKQYTNMTEIIFSIECSDQRTAEEKAFEEAMRIHKNMCMKDKDFSNNYYYLGIQLVRVVPRYN